MFGIKKDLYRNFGFGFALGAVLVVMHLVGVGQAAPF